MQADLSARASQELPCSKEQSSRDLPAFWGELGGITVADLIEFIQTLEKSGTLWIQMGFESAVLGFYEGCLVNARFDSDPKIGEALVQRGLVPEKTIEAVVVKQRREGGSVNLGRRLVDLGLITETQVASFMAELTKATIMRLLVRNSGSFDFVIGKPPGFRSANAADGDPRLSHQKIRSQGVLLEVARMLDESRRSADVLELQG